MTDKRIAVVIPAYRVRARIMEVLGRARTDAERLIRLYFEGQKIDRKSMVARGMGQRDWERAQKLGPSEALAQSTYDGYKAAWEAAKGS